MLQSCRLRRLSPAKRETVLFVLGRGLRRLASVRREYGAAAAKRQRSTSTARLEPRLAPTEAYIAVMARTFTYHPQHYDGCVTLLWAADSPSPRPGDPTHGWHEFATDVVVRTIPGDHVTSTAEYVDALGNRLKQLLDGEQALPPTAELTGSTISV